MSLRDAWWLGGLVVAVPFIILYLVRYVSALPNLIKNIKEMVLWLHVLIGLI